MIRIGGGCFSMTRIWTEEVWVRRSRRSDSSVLEVKCVLRIARRMIGRRVQRVEAMILVLDLGAVRDDEADLAEDADDVFGHLGERVQFAQRRGGGRAK